MNAEDTHIAFIDMNVSLRMWGPQGHVTEGGEQLHHWPSPSPLLWAQTQA